MLKLGIHMCHTGLELKTTRRNVLYEMINEDGFYHEMIKKDLCDTWTMNCSIMGLRIVLLARILPFICPFLSSFLCFCI